MASYRNTMHTNKTMVFTKYTSKEYHDCIEYEITMVYVKQTGITTVISGSSDFHTLVVGCVKRSIWLRP